MESKLVLKNILEECGFTFGVDNNGNHIAITSPESEKEYRHVRENIGISDLSYIKIYKVTGNDAMDFLDFIVSGDVGNIKEEEILHSFIMDGNAKIISDIYVANDSEDFIVFADGGDYSKLDQIIKEQSSNFNVTTEEVSHLYGLFSVDGPYSWFPLKKLFSTQIIGVSYLNFMKIEDGFDTYIFRGGKTGERGYWLMTKRENTMSLLNKIKSLSDPYPISFFGTKVSELLRLENYFLNYNEIKYSHNPYEMGLFWQIFTDKETSNGKILEEVNSNGIKRWVVGFTANSTDSAIKEGDIISLNDRQIGVVINTSYSFSLKKIIGRALIDKDYAFSGFSYMVNDVPITTVTMPFIVNKSLTVKPE